MMGRRVTPPGAAVILAALLLGAPAEAARASCRLVRDPRGDATSVFGEVAGPNAPSLDIVSVDVAANRTQLTGVIRVERLADLATDAPAGAVFVLPFHNAAGGFSLIAIKTPRNSGFLVRSYQGEGPVAGQDDIRGVFDTARSEIRISVPLRNFRGAVRYGGRIHIPGWVRTARLYGTYQPGTPTAEVPIGQVDEEIGIRIDADKTADGADYIVGRPSCVRVGR